MEPKLNRRGITFAAAILLVFTIALVGFLAYMAVTTPSGQKAYFENLEFAIQPYKIWHVGVPIEMSGNLQLSFTTELPIRVYAKYSNMYLLDRITSGPQDFTMKVDPSMSIVEVAFVNLYNTTMTVDNATCTLA
jgi:hypothetical protein